MQQRQQDKGTKNVVAAAQDRSICSSRCRFERSAVARVSHLGIAVKVSSSSPVSVVDLSADTLALYLYFSRLVLLMDSSKILFMVVYPTF